MPTAIKKTAIEKYELAMEALAEHNSVRAAARSLGIAPSTFQHWQKPPAKGKLRAPGRDVLPLPARGTNKVYILTSAQNATALHEACWKSLQTLAKHDNAELMIARFTYDVHSEASSGQKLANEHKTSRERKRAEEDLWWDKRLTPYFCDKSVEIAPGLVWCGELQILPTAVDPIAGLEAYTGRASSIIPHAKFAVKSVPSPKSKGTKFVYTTGAITQRNYIQKKTGQKASFHHGYGAVIVEVTDDGSWFVRQLNADSEGVIFDLDKRVAGSKITFGNRPEALVWGDIHTRQLEPALRELGWGRNGILDTLRPKRQVLHDVLDFRSQNHHDRKDPWKTFEKHVDGQLSVDDELKELVGFLHDAERPWCETIIAAANHDEALIRWLKEGDYKTDPLNAELFLELTWRTYRAMRGKDKNFYTVEYATMRHYGKTFSKPPFVWLRRDEEYIVCPDAAGGIELGMHGDKGANGAKGQLKQFARSGRKCIIADSHVAGLHEGAMQVGVMGNLDQGYNEGPSAWSHTNAIVYENGKRSLFTIWQGRWNGRVERKSKGKIAA